MGRDQPLFLDGCPLLPDAASSQFHWAHQESKAKLWIPLKLTAMLAVLFTWVSGVNCQASEELLQEETQERGE